jgi:hypothetical protein
MVNNLLMRRVIARYVRKIYMQTGGNVNEFLREIKLFEDSNFVMPIYKSFYQDVKAHFLQRSFGRDLSRKIQAYGE